MNATTAKQTVTNEDLLGAIQDLMQMTHDGFEKLNGRMDRLEARMDRLEDRGPKITDEEVRELQRLLQIVVDWALRAAQAIKVPLKLHK